MKAVKLWYLICPKYHENRFDGERFPSSHQRIPQVVAWLHNFRSIFSTHLHCWDRRYIKSSGLDVRKHSDLVTSGLVLDVRLRAEFYPDRFVLHIYLCIVHIPIVHFVH